MLVASTNPNGCVESGAPKVFSQSSIAMTPPIVPVSYLEWVVSRENYAGKVYNPHPKRIPPKPFLKRKKSVSQHTSRPSASRESSPAKADIMTAHMSEDEETPPPAPETAPPAIVKYEAACKG